MKTATLMPPTFQEMLKKYRLKPINCIKPSKGIHRENNEKKFEQTTTPEHVSRIRAERVMNHAQGMGDFSSCDGILLDEKIEEKSRKKKIKYSETMLVDKSSFDKPIDVTVRQEMWK